MVKINKIWVVLSDEEGIAAMLTGATWFPMVSADENKAKMMAAEAQKLSDQTGMIFKLVEFSVRKDIELIEPVKKGKVH